jgi:integral membrane protein
MQKTLKFLQLVAILEAISWLALLIAMFFKYVLNNETYIRSVGSIHGVLFMLFVALVLVVGLGMKWSKKEIFWSLVSSLPPCCTIIADIKIFRKYVDNGFTKTH